MALGKASNVNKKPYSRTPSLTLFLYRNLILSHTAQFLPNTEFLLEDKVAMDALPLRRTWRVAECVLRFFVVIGNLWNFVVLLVLDLFLTDVFDVFSTGFDSASVDFDFSVILVNFL